MILIFSIELHSHVLSSVTSTLVYVHVIEHSTCKSGWQLKNVRVNKLLLKFIILNVQQIKQSREKVHYFTIMVVGYQVMNITTNWLLPQTLGHKLAIATDQ